MSKENPTIREQAEIIILRALKATESDYMDAINKEEGTLSRLDLIDRYVSAMTVIATALQTVSTESPC